MRPSRLAEPWFFLQFAPLLMAGGILVVIGASGVARVLGVVLFGVGVVFLARAVALFRKGPEA